MDMVVALVAVMVVVSSPCYLMHAFYLFIYQSTALGSRPVTTGTEVKSFSNTSLDNFANDILNFQASESKTILMSGISFC